MVSLTGFCFEVLLLSGSELLVSLSPVSLSLTAIPDSSSTRRGYAPASDRSKARTYPCLRLLSKRIAIGYWDNRMIPSSLFGIIHPVILKECNLWFQRLQNQLDQPETNVAQIYLPKESSANSVRFIFRAILPLSF